jgi:acetyl-CoA carboxylase biotin carboxyl carrier protein
LSEKRNPKKKAKAAAGAPSAGGPLDVDLLEQIVALMAANDLNTVDVRNGDRRIILKRGAAGGPVQFFQPAPVHSAAHAATPNASGAASSSSLGAPPVDDESKYLRITSPMVGTFYAAAKPGEKPLMSVGSAVTEETDVCLVEAMKNFMPVPAGCRGTIAKVMVQDGEPVQFGTTLFLVTPS